MYRRLCMQYQMHIFIFKNQLKFSSGLQKRTPWLKKPHKQKKTLINVDFVFDTQIFLVLSSPGYLWLGQREKIEEKNQSAPFSTPTNNWKSKRP